MQSGYQIYKKTRCYEIVHPDFLTCFQLFQLSNYKICYKYAKQEKLLKSKNPKNRIQWKRSNLGSPVTPCEKRAILKVLLNSQMTAKQIVDASRVNTHIKKRSTSSQSCI